MSDRAVSVLGGCLCGEVRYAADVFLETGYYCHCTICQKSTGQPAEISVPVKIGSLRFTRGAPKYFQSSVWLKRGFCGTCGSRLVNVAVDPTLEWATNIDVGSLDHPERVQPILHVFSDRQLPWYRPDESLPHVREEEAEDRFVGEMKARLGILDDRASRR